MGFAAIVLAGGRASRLSGVDKMAIEVDGRTLLRRTLDAVAGAEPIIVVGPRREVSVEVRWTRERPVHAGPVAALAAGVAELRTVSDPAEVAVLAADLAGITPSTVDRLRAALGEDPGMAGAVLVDSGGVRQWLIGVWRLGALRQALPADPAGRALRAVLGTLPLAEVPEEPGETDDVDTPEDLRRLR
jgi:molybdopterin-guanine dinucleotide biosynthesis protein A